MISENFEEKKIISGSAIFLGMASTGKTSILNKYFSNVFSENYIATYGFDVKNQEFEIEESQVVINFYDTAGQERYESINSNTLKKTNGAIFVYDITNPKSFEKVNFWNQELKTKGYNNSALLLIGNKYDLEEDRQINFEQGQQKAKEIGCSFLESSAKTGFHIKDIFELVAKVIYNNKKKKGLLYNSTFSLEEQQKKKKGCCEGKSKKNNN